MKCPSCAQVELAGNLKRCPSCGADVTLLNRIQEMGSYFYNASLSVTAHDNNKALLYAATAVALDDALIPAKKLLGKMLWQRGLRTEALHYFQSAAESAPADTDITHLLKEARVRAQKVDEAPPAQEKKSSTPMPQSTDAHRAPVQPMNEKPRESGTFVFIVLGGVAAALFAFVLVINNTLNDKISDLGQRLSLQSETLKQMEAVSRKSEEQRTSDAAAQASRLDALAKTLAAQEKDVQKALSDYQNGAQKRNERIDKQVDALAGNQEITAKKISSLESSMGLLAQRMEQADTEVQKLSKSVQESAAKQTQQQKDISSAEESARGALDKTSKSADQLMRRITEIETELHATASRPADQSTLIEKMISVVETLRPQQAQRLARRIETARQTLQGSVGKEREDAERVLKEAEQEYASNFFAIHQLECRLKEELARKK